jgi:hypothetical protein
MFSGDEVWSRGRRQSPRLQHRVASRLRSLLKNLTPTATYTETRNELSFSVPAKPLHRAYFNVAANVFHAREEHIAGIEQAGSPENISNHFYGFHAFYPKLIFIRLP